MQNTIDLSCDLGEAESPRGRLREEEIWPLITSANVACGGHAGDRDSMELAVQSAQRHRVALGAHPSYPDRLHFGRERMPITPAALRESLVEQITEFRDIATESVPLSHVKPHGALYNEAHLDGALAALIVDAIRSADPRLRIVCAPGSKLLEAAGSLAIAEGFADRRYRDDGSLVPRSEPGALLLDFDEAAEQAVSLARSGRYGTLCVHGDMDRAPERLRAIRAKLEAAGFAIVRPGR
jgi:UPF0271 protein